MLHGARNSLVIASCAVLLAASLGLLAGLWAGFSRGVMDGVLMRLGDMQLAFPFILLAIIVLGVSPERSAWQLILVLGIPGWILYARVVRARVLAERDKDHVTAARSLGAGQLRQLRKYVLPSVWQVVVVIALLDLGYVILVESTLSFLGFGLAQPTPSWGSILAEGRRNMLNSPWLAVIPGFAILLTVLAVNLMADGAADVLDPSLKRGRFKRARLAPLPAGMSDPGPGLPIPDADPGADRQPLVAPGDGPAGPASGRGAMLLEVVDLAVMIPLEDRVIHAVRRVSLRVRRGETVGIVGESGSGKSMTALAIIGLLETPGRVTGGRIAFEGRDLLRIPDREMAALRGRRIGMVFQNPASSLNPVLTTGAQMEETIRLHRQVTTAQARELAAGALIEVGIGDPGRVLSRYPFQLSGGMNQRIMIALAMLSQPDLLIADEPTTALDVTTQAQVLERLRAVTQEHHTALILISHDIALVSQYVDRVVVLYAGQVCESGPVADVIRAPAHPYTRALLRSAPRADIAARRTPDRDPGRAARPGRPADRLPLRRPLSERPGRLLDDATRRCCRWPGRLPMAGDRAAACHFADPVA